MSMYDLLATLTSGKIDYVLVGGLAVALHGYQRVTMDVDVVLALDEENIAKFVDCAKSANLKPVLPIPIDSLRDAALIDQWHREKGMLAFALREPHIGGSVVDVLVRSDVPYDTLMANAVAGELFGRKVWIASID